MNIEWWHVGLVMVVLLIVREILALVFGWGSEDENGISWEECRDPEGGTFRKMFNLHKRQRVYTSIRPDLGEDTSTASGFVELSRPVGKGE